MPIATKNDIIDLSSENKTEELANKVLAKIKLGDVVFLYGEMGVGKTTFVRYFINGLQKKNKLKLTEVTSPTFNIMNEYQVGTLLIKHYDLYRLKSHDELKDLNMFDYNDNEILLVEWPEIIKNEPNLVTKLYFKYDNQYHKRFINVLS